MRCDGVKLVGGWGWVGQERGEVGLVRSGDGGWWCCVARMMG